MCIRDRDIVHAGGTCFRVTIDAPEPDEPVLSSVLEEVMPSGIFRVRGPGMNPSAVVDRIANQSVQFVIERPLQKKASAYGTIQQVVESMMHFGPIVVTPENTSAAHALCESLSGDQYVVVTNQSTAKTVQLLRDRIGSFVSPQALHQHLQNPAPGYAQQLIAEWDSILIVEPNDDCTLYSQHSCKSCLEDRTFGLV